MTSPSTQLSNVIIILGAPNDKQGNLSKMAKARADKAIELNNQIDNAKLILTGGFGKFNESLDPHYLHVQKYLLENKISKNSILGMLPSSHTVEDAFLSMILLKKYSVGKIHIVTSEFHGRRAHLIFEHFFPPCKLNIVTTANGETRLQINRRILHEKKQIQTIENQGGVIVEGKLYTRKL